MKTATRNAYSPGEPLATQEARPVERSGGMNTEPSASWDARSMQQLELSDFSFDGEHPWRDEGVLRELYIERDLTVAQIGRLLGCHPSTPLQHMEEHDIPRDRYGKQRESIPEDTLRELYLSRGMTMEEISNELGVGLSTVHDRIHEKGLPTESGWNGGSQLYIKDPDRLQRLYINRGLSTREIAEWLGCSAASVSVALDEYGIESRSEGEAVADERVKDESILRELYVRRGLTQKALAERFGSSRVTVRKYLREYGIPTHTPGAQLPGEKSPHWKGGTPKHYGPLWRTQRRKARERDGYACRNCGFLDEEHEGQYGCALPVHHIQRYASFDDDERAHRLENLITLCTPCHAELEGLSAKALADRLDREAHADAEADAVADGGER